ncbi:response regulator transcription factor [Novispirillum sp. DQ9]|uniref:response regulator transcription factor n=1 Tax=Novispirillum sp. DQ9 TaxID=3398612 RepID=UPI003C7ACAA4
MSDRTIYVVEDDPDVRDLVERVLTDYGFTVTLFAGGQALLAAIRHKAPDLCLIDLGLPDMDGLALVRALFGDVRFGVVILTGRGDVSDRVLGLELGADDYIVKPFEPRELVARVNSTIRRKEQVLAASMPAAASRRLARFAAWRFDAGNLCLLDAAGQAQQLSKAEADLLSAFLRAPKRVLSRDQLQDDAVYRDDPVFDRAIDVRISRLRKKLGDDPRKPALIKTVYGAGYLFTADVAWE